MVSKHGKNRKWIWKNKDVGIKMWEKSNEKNSFNCLFIIHESIIFITHFFICF
jgi:hypothetical protein